MSKYYLNSIEEDQLSHLAENLTLLNAVKKVLLEGVYSNGVLVAGENAESGRNFALSLAFSKEASNEQIGADLRACAEGIRIIESGFKELEKFKVVTPEVDSKNEAR